MTGKTKATRTIIHVNRQRIDRNRKRLLKGETLEPALTCRRGHQKVEYGNVLVLRYKNIEVARFVYRPDLPLPCGAVAWAETGNCTVEVLQEVKPASVNQSLPTTVQEALRILAAHIQQSVDAPRLASSP